MLFGNDEARTKLFEDTVAAEERRGLPRKHPTYGARYWPAVKAYFDYEWGLVAEPPFAATVAMPDEAGSRARVDEIATAYKRAFDQESDVWVTGFTFTRSLATPHRILKQAHSLLGGKCRS